MQELIEQFRLEMMSKLFENIPRFLQWRQESLIINKIIEGLKNLQETDVIANKYTQKLLYENLDLIILEVGFNVNFLYNPDARFENKLGSYSRLTDSIFLNLKNMNINKTNNFLNDKNALIYNLQFNDELISILHHELAHRAFHNKFPDNYSFLKFKHRDYDMRGIDSIDEQNSILQELFHYATLTKGVSIDSPAEFFKFLLLLSKSDNLYDKEVLNTILSIQDFEAFQNKLIKINVRLNNSRFRMNDVFGKFLEYLLTNNIKFKSPIELIKYIIDNKNKIPECQNMFNLKQKMSYNKYFAGCIDILNKFEEEKTLAKNILGEQINFLLKKNVYKSQDEELMIKEFFQFCDSEDYITKHDLERLKSGKERIISLAIKCLSDGKDKEEIIQQLKQIEV